MECKERLERYLREQSAPLQLHQHVEVFTAQELAATEHVPGSEFAKVVMIVADGSLLMLALPSTKHVDLEKVRGVLAADDVRLASESDFSGRFPDCDTGAMPPFGNLYDMPLYIDEGLTRNETIHFQAGTHTDTMTMAFTDYRRVAQPEIASLVAGGQRGTLRKGGQS